MENKHYNLCYITEVLRVDDDAKGLRIKVRLPYYDIDKTDNELPYAFPLMPKFLHVNPKVGECVIVITQEFDNTGSQRFFIGPIISQDYYLDKDPYNFSSRTLLTGLQTQIPLPNPDLNANNKGTIPDREDIAIRGRNNSDIILKPNELRLRCGFKKEPNSIDSKNALNFNREDLAYIQMRYAKMKDAKKKEYSSMINVVADRINLLSHDGNETFTLADSEQLITDTEQLKIQTNTEPMVYGQKLVDYLKKLIELFKTHDHTFIKDPPEFDQNETNILSYDLNQLLSQNIRIN